MTLTHKSVHPITPDPFRSIGATVMDWRFIRTVTIYAMQTASDISDKPREISDTRVRYIDLHATTDAKYSTDLDRRIITRAARLPDTTPEHFVTMLRKSGRTETADRIEELIRICEEDEEENYRMDSLESIAHFFLGVPKDKNISDISVSPDGTFIAEWIGPDGKILVAMEFLGDKVLLIRKVDGRAKASQVDQLEAQSYLP